MSADLSDVQGMETDLYDEQLLLQKDDLAAEVEKMRMQMAMVQLERAERERKRLADEEKRARKQREAEMQQVALMKHIEERLERVSEPPLVEDQRVAIDGMGKIDDHWQPQPPGAGCRVSRGLVTNIPEGSSPRSNANLESVLSPPGPQCRPLPPLPLARRQTLNPEDHDAEGVYGGQDERGGYQLSQRRTSGRYVEDGGSCLNDLDLSLLADRGPLDHTSYYKPPRLDCGPPVAASPSEILRELRLQQSELVHAQNSGGGTTNVSVGSGDIMGSSLSNVGNIINTTYVFIGAPF